MKSDSGEASNAQPAIDRSDSIAENVAAARRAVEAAEAELDRVIGAIEAAPRVEKQLVSVAVAAALVTLREALAKLASAQSLLANSPDKA